MKLDQTETPTVDDTERARQIAAQIINGIAVEGFENDADAVKALQGQLSSVATVIERVMSE